ncbi:MAG: methylcobalamin:coenzyme M methyltransferase [candidate division TA06 bacterium ADurb.Bin417]|uniref:Methylcobalamin:coenzyme M methyltransferase n=1 Tax=candidate division TA06 bacterium ADurb.Bin417 TaxID=1852828 RepID=A0A1V5M8M6_UNCT6|nr:MAG: methylcobalamin:coenzyme M methyltransferase [candidate division TA06 bacterium ADurb.Bin417]
MDRLTSRQRLRRTLAGEPVDRIAISLYEFDGHYESWIHRFPEYQALLDYAAGKTDRLFSWAPASATPTLFYGQVEPDTVRVEAWVEGTSRFRRSRIRTPRGELTSLSRTDEGVHTGWQIEHPCKDEKDAERVLSLPFIPWRPPADNFFAVEARLGDTGLAMGDIPDALCCTVELFGFARFLTLYLDNPDLVIRLMDFFQERLEAYLEHLLVSGAVTIYRICGPEYATPPYLPPSAFRRLVFDYDRRLVEILHRHGGRARLHSHGRIGRVLDQIAALGIDAIDPLEPPPDGDATLDEVRSALGSRMVLVGNVEERLLEIGSAAEIEAAVRSAVEAGARGGPFILCPTAMPLTTPLSEKVQGNIRHYIDCGLKYGGA